MHHKATMDSPTADPDGFLTGGFFVAHAFARQNGVTTDLAALAAVPDNDAWARLSETKLRTGGKS
jgi:hypothetical protein